MDMRQQLQDARERMLKTQQDFDRYVKTNVTDLSVFQSLFKAAQEANAAYSMLLKEYTGHKYSHLSKESEILGL